MGKRLYVGNLSFQTTEDALREAFGADGREVAEVKIMLERDTGRSRGFAFVEMGTDEDAQGAIEAMDGHELDGRPLRVNEAQPRQDFGGRGGGGGGGGADVAAAAVGFPSSHSPRAAARQASAAASARAGEHGAGGGGGGVPARVLAHPGQGFADPGRRGCVLSGAARRTRQGFGHGHGFGGRFWPRGRGWRPVPPLCLPSRAQTISLAAGKAS